MLPFQAAAADRVARAVPLRKARELLEAVAARYPSTFGDIWLLPFFLASLWTFRTVQAFHLWGIDGAIYYHGAAAWLRGDDPWTAAIPGVALHYYALPPSLLLYAPFTVIPAAIFVPLHWLATLAASIYCVRAVGLPLWWLLWPPILQGIVVGQPHMLLLAALLSRHAVVQALAPVIKAYGIVPLFGEGRWRAVAIATAFIGLTVVLMWPQWWSYLSRAGELSARLLVETKGSKSAWGDPILLAFTVPALALLAVLRPREGGWISVPAIWPGGHHFYASFALPLVAGRPWLAVLCCLPHGAVFAAPALALAALASPPDHPPPRQQLGGVRKARS